MSGLLLLIVVAVALGYRATLASTVNQLWSLPSPSWKAIVIAAGAVLTSYWWSALALRIVAAVILFRILTFWGPILPGAVSARVLRHRLAL